MYSHQTRIDNSGRVGECQKVNRLAVNCPAVPVVQASSDSLWASTWCRIRKRAGSQWVVRCVSTISGRVVSARHLCRATAVLGQAAQLWVFILGTAVPLPWHTKCVFGYTWVCGVRTGHWDSAGRVEHMLRGRLLIPARHDIHQSWVTNPESQEGMSLVTSTHTYTHTQTGA